MKQIKLTIEQITALKNYRTQLQVWKSATNGLSNLWTDLDGTTHNLVQEAVDNEVGMPFTVSFDEFSSHTSEWVETTINLLNKTIEMYELAAKLPDEWNNFLLVKDNYNCPVTLFQLCIDNPELYVGHINDLSKLNVGETATINMGAGGKTNFIRLKDIPELPVGYILPDENGDYQLYDDEGNRRTDFGFTSAQQAEGWFFDNTKPDDDAMQVVLKEGGKSIDFNAECERFVREVNGTDWTSIDELKSRFNKLKEWSSELLAVKTVLNAQ